MKSFIFGCPEGWFLRVWVSKWHPDALLAKTMLTCLASSLVGDSSRALKPCFLGSFRWCRTGSKKAAVFPDPVGAHAKISRFWKRNCQIKLMYQIQGAKLGGTIKFLHWAKICTGFYTHHLWVAFEDAIGLLGNNLNFEPWNTKKDITVSVSAAHDYCITL